MLHFSAALQEAFLGYKKTTYIGAGNKGPIEIKSAWKPVVNKELSHMCPPYPPGEWQRQQLNFKVKKAVSAQNYPFLSKIWIFSRDPFPLGPDQKNLI